MSNLRQKIEVTENDLIKIKMIFIKKYKFSVI